VATGGEATAGGRLGPGDEGDGAAVTGEAGDGDGLGDGGNSIW
jgi:hypothetical protein